MVLLRVLLVLCLMGLNGCQPAKKGVGGGSQGAADPRCGELQQASCANAADCKWTGTQCSGTETYCGQFTTINACPGVSCQWSPSGNRCQSFASVPPVVSSSCANYTQQSTCAMVATCSWNGVSCVTNNNGGSTNNTTGGPFPGTGTPTNTTGFPTTTTGGNLPPSGVCTQLNVWQCVLTKGCSYYLLPKGHCDIQQQ